MNKVVEHETMYRDMINILKESGLANLIKSKDFEKYAIHTTHLKKGHFYLASGGGKPFGYIFYVNPVDWYQEDEVGLVYLTLHNVRKMLEDPSIDPMNTLQGGWNATHSDIDAIEDYRGTHELISFKLNNLEKGDFDFFRNDGFVFYEIPNPNARLGLFNWWW